jgi:hypothetical protein
VEEARRLPNVAIRPEYAIEDQPMSKTNSTADSLSSDIRKVRLRMDLVSLDSINYRRFCDCKAIIQSWNNPIAKVFHRNCIAFNGTRISVSHLRTTTVTRGVKIILISYSLHTISGFNRSETSELESLVFEFGSELQSMTDSVFSYSRLRSLFFPPKASLCSLRQLSRELFSRLWGIGVITIPSSVKRIESGAFASCRFLRVVQFEFPSHCGSIFSDAFDECSLLGPISLPSSVEFIEYDDRWDSRFPFVVNNHNFWIRDDCLVRTNGRKVVRYIYLGCSQAFCVSREITVLGSQLQYIRNKAFSVCPLSEVVIPDSWKSIPLLSQLRSGEIA